MQMRWELSSWYHFRLLPIEQVPGNCNLTKLLSFWLLRTLPKQVDKIQLFHNYEIYNLKKKKPQIPSFQGRMDAFYYKTQYLMYFHILCLNFHFYQIDSQISLICGFTGGSLVDSKESACNAGGPGSIPGSRRPSGEGKWQPTPVFLFGKSHGWRSLAVYSPWVLKELDMTEWLHRCSVCLWKRFLGRICFCPRKKARYQHLDCVKFNI